MTLILLFFLLFSSIMVCKKAYSLVVVPQSNRILLGFKKRGFGQGRWNGFGGKPEAGETMEQCARRELLEEAGLEAKVIAQFGVINFEFVGVEEWMEVHVFRVDAFEGEPIESDEMRPQWFPLTDIPFDKMWPDDVVWLPQLLRGNKFNAYYKFLGHDKIVEEKFEINDVLNKAFGEY